MITSRDIAYKILMDIWDNNAYSNLTINKHIIEFNAEKDENFIREIVYGTLENKIYIDYIIKKLSKIKLEKIHKNIFIILRIGIYQLLFMDSVPDRAAVNESVDLAKKYGNKGSVGFVNGMLRNFSRNKSKVSKIEVKDEAEKISIKYSHPIWMVDYFISEFGYDFTKELCMSNNKKPNFTIRVNKLKTTKEILRLKLEEKEFKVRESEYHENSLLIDNPKSITRLEEYKEGLFTIQDESSSLVGVVMNPKSGSKVLDLCAAPGGKTTHIAEIMNNKGEIIAGDIHEHRVNLIKENAKRLKIDIIEAGVQDALKLKESYLNGFDYCLVDAPCSGLGTIRKNPEIKFSKKYSDIEDLSRIQKTILENAKNYVKKDGILIYSTCTIGKKENEDIVESFLEKNPSYKLEKISIESLESDDKYIKLYPNIHGTDGFFIAKMIRII